MSGFGDIARAYDAYAATGDWGAVNYGLIYTCNAGWVDLGHLNPTSRRATIGASNLWGQIKDGGSVAVKPNCTIDGQLRAHDYGGMLYGAYNGYRCDRAPYYTFADGQTGFDVRYRQDHGGLPGKLGVERDYIVKSGLTLGRKKAVALAIFMQVSNRFEWLQTIGGLGGLITDSGFSQEDLVSNLIGFYVAIGDVTKAGAIDACHPVSRATAEAVWQGSGAVGQGWSRSFNPRLKDTVVDDATAMVCRDECMAQPRRFPDVFQTVTPAESGVDFADMGAGPNLRF